MNDVSGMKVAGQSVHIQRLTEHNHARGDNHIRHGRTQPVIKLHDINPKPADAIVRINEVGKLVCLVVILKCRHLEQNFFIAPQDFHADSFVGSVQIKRRSQARQTQDRATVDCDHDIPQLQSSRVGWTSERHIRDDDSPVLCQSKPGGKSRGDGLRAGLDLCPVHVSILPQVPLHERHHPGGYGKAESFAATALAEDECIQPDDVAIQIHQRPAAVPRVDGSVGL